MIPNNIVKILKNIKINSDYKDTYYFNNATQQYNFFNSNVKFTFDKLNYTRKEKHIRVKKNVESLFDCNYIMYQNTNFSNKWFYGFITDIRYVSENVSDIFYSIDVMQTWLFDWELKTCFVEREHVSNDSIGRHTVDENLNIGELITIESIDFEDLLPLKIGVAYHDPQNNFTGLLKGKIYTAIKYEFFDNPYYVNELLDSFDKEGIGDTVISIFMFPAALTATVGDEFSPVPRSIIIPPNLTSLDNGYVPRNKKLFCYPYNYLEVTNNQGQANNYRYERFGLDGTIFFDAQASINPAPTVYLTPRNYNGELKNVSNGLTLGDFPICDWINDTYKNWLALNAFSTTVGFATSVVGLGVGVATGNPLAISSGVISTANNIGALYEKSIEPNKLKGTVSGSTNITINKQTFTFNKKTITRETARIIDDFFDRYGYKINRNKIPNISSRPVWNYVKCGEVSISGNIINSHLNIIRENFLNGITFWKNNNVGDYSQNNQI